MLYIGNKKVKVYIGDKKVKKGYIGNVLCYSSGNPVTYHVDTSIIYTEEVEDGATCLSPTTFTPAKSGYTFKGWREDSTANSSVLSSKVMGDSPITLYAVFQKNIVLTTYNNSPNATTQTKQQYYNNGNVVNPSFTLTQNTQSGWTPLGWCTSNSATASIVQNNGATITLSSNATYYGKYSQTITLSYNGNGATGGSTAAQTGTRYYNSGNYSNPSFTLRSNGYTRTYGTFTKWAMGNVNGTQYSVGSNVTLSSNTVFYAKWTLLIPNTQSGSFGGFHQDSSGIDGSQTKHVTFSPAFSSPPIITIDVVWSGHSTDKYGTGSSNVTTTGADIGISIWETGSTNYGYTLYWTASGNIIQYV